MNTRSKKILLVEDDPVMAMVQKMILEKNGFSVDIANSGEKAIETMETNSEFDLILMDINLGIGIDGTVAAEKILQKFDLPLIFLSSHTEEDIVEKTEGITSYGYIVKDSGETVLIAGIKMAFRLFESRIKEKENNLALQKSEKRYKAIVELQMDLICRWLSDTTLTFVNEGYCQFFGKTKQDLLNKKWIELVPADAREKVTSMYAELIQKKEKNTYEHEVIDSLGNISWIHWIDTPLFDEEGNFLEFQSVGRDITSKKKSEMLLLESESIYRSTFNSLGPLWIAETETGNIINANLAAIQFYGYSIEEFQNRKIHDIQIPDQNSFESKSNIITRRHIKKDGRPIDVRVQERELVWKGKNCLIFELVLDT